MNAQKTLADLKATPPALTEDALIGIDRALSKYAELLDQAIANGADPTTESMSDLVEMHHAAQSWLMHVQACRPDDEESS
jgi:hypothetical protein